MIFRFLFIVLLSISFPSHGRSATCQYSNLETKESVSGACTSGPAGIAIDTNPHLRRFAIEEVARQGEWAIVKFNGKKASRFEVNRCHFSYSTEDLKEFLTIDSCQRAQEVDKRPEFMTAGGSWVGKWHIGDTKVCRGKPGDAEGLLVYSTTKMFGYENECDVKKIEPRGTGVELTMTCYGEGETSTERETLDVTNGKLIRSIRTSRKTERFTYNRCP